MCNGHSPSLPNMTRKVWFLSLIRDLENCLVHIKKDHFEKIWESIFLSSSWSFRILSQNIPSPTESNSVAGATIVSFSWKNQIGVLEFEVVRLKKDHFEKIWESIFLSSSWSFRNLSQNILSPSESNSVADPRLSKSLKYKFYISNLVLHWYKPFNRSYVQCFF